MTDKDKIEQTFGNNPRGAYIKSTWTTRKRTPALRNSRRCSG